MPRESYFQNPGNPVQHDKLPAEELQLQFTRHSNDPDADRQYSRSVLRVLYLISGICLAGVTVSGLLPFPFPLNLSLGLLVFHRMLRLDRVTSIFQPHLALLGIPFAIHMSGLPWVHRVAFTITCAAYVGREFARHHVALATQDLLDRTVADTERERWDGYTVLSSLVVIPFGLLLVAPTSAALWLLLMVSGLFTLGLVSTSPSVCHAIRTAWTTWCTYNRDDEAAPGLLLSPAGSWATRLSLTVFLVSNVTLMLASGLPLAQLVWGDFHTTGGTGMILVWTVVVLTLVGIPVALALVLMFLVALPAIVRFRSLNSATPAKPNWQAVTETIRNSPNPVERDSLYFGRLAHDGSPLLIPRSVFREHAHILGDSGSGKTARGLIPLAEQLIADRNSSLMVIDLKGDSQEILSSLAACANRPNWPTIPLRHFSIREDQASFAFNPFQLPCWQQLNLYQRTDVLCGALGLTYGTDYGRGFYSSANASVLHATLKAYPELGSFVELSDRIAFVTSRPKAHGLNDGQSDAGNHVRMIADRLASFKPLNVTPQNTPSSEVNRQAMDPAQLFAQQEIFYFHLSTTLGPGSSPEIARLAMFMLLTTATLTQQRRQVYLMIDEFQRVAAHHVNAILQIARSMNIGVILANQSMLDLKRDDLTHVVEANCRYRQWYAISSPEEQQRLAKASGETVESLHTVSQSRQTEGWGTRSTTTGHSVQQTVLPRLSLNDIKLASDDPNTSIALVTRGAGYSQYGGMPVVIESPFHISEEEFLARKNAPWPTATDGSFVPRNWKPQPPTRPSKRRKNGPLVTEETIGDEPDLFDQFLADKSRRTSS